jgi:SAM-dependent methyltransferase
VIEESVQTKEWFGEWFDSPYYHILYRDRDHQEAQKFIDKVVDHFGLTSEDHILDLACGKGRHSIYLNEKGFDVIGVDLSEQNISHANELANARLKFFEHDMREVFREATFDYILNLFTSFGYFDAQAENQMAVSAMEKGLKPGGSLLLDFLNPYKVVNNLVPEDVKIVDDIEFHITKHLSEDNYIIKDIRFEDKGKDYHFQERVKAIRRLEFLNFFESSGLEVLEVFGDYQLNAYDREVSDRMIFIVKKKK